MLSKILKRMLYAIIVILTLIIGWYLLNDIDKTKFQQRVVEFSNVASTTAGKKALLSGETYPIELDVNDPEITYEGSIKFISGTVMVYEDKVMITNMTDGKLCANGYTDKLKTKKGNCK